MSVERKYDLKIEINGDTLRALHAALEELSNNQYKLMSTSNTSRIRSNYAFTWNLTEASED